MSTDKSKYSHDFLNLYTGLIGFGWDRETDENSLICYLQMFSDDLLQKTLVEKLSDKDIDEIQAMIHRILKKHFTESEYHQLFLKDNHS
jgi:hypothetical protein